jgi:twinkle protein
MSAFLRISRIKRLSLRFLSANAFANPEIIANQTRTQSQSQPVLGEDFAVSPVIQQTGTRIPVSKFHTFDPQTLLEFLNRKEIEHRHSSDHSKVILKYCPFCHAHNNKTDNLWKLAMFMDTGNFYCIRCQAVGSYYDLQNKLNGGAMSVVSAKTLTSGPSSKLSTQAQYFDSAENQVYCENLFKESPQFDRARTYLTDTRKIEESVLKLYQAKIESFPSDKSDSFKKYHEEVCVTFPIIHDSKIRRVKVRSVQEKAHQRSYPTGGKAGFFGWHTVPRDAKTVIITEGEFDAMAAYQGTQIPAISLPNGARSFPVDLIPYLERFEKIYLWLDDDVPGQEGAEKIAKKLGVSRCYLVRSRKNDPLGPKDANDVLKCGIDMPDLLSKSSRLTHKQIATFADIRDDVFLEVIEGNRLNGVPYSTLPRLTSILKGHRKGELTILTGSTGIGKTTVLSQMSIDLCNQGVPTLWGSFEIQNQRLARMMMSQKSNSALSTANFNEIADSFEQLPLYFLKFHGSTDIGSVLDAMDHAVYVYDVEHILLDNLQFMLGTGSSRFDRFEQQDHAVAAFRSFATRKNVHITLAVHPRKEHEDLLSITSVFGSAKVTQEADNVILVQSLDKDRQLRTINVQKNRYDGDIGHIPFKFDKFSRRIMEMSQYEFEEQKRRLNQGHGINIGGSKDLASQIASQSEPQPQPPQQQQQSKPTSITLDSSSYNPLSILYE